MTQLMRHIDDVTPPSPFGSRGRAAEIYDFVHTLVVSQCHQEEATYFGKSACGTEVIVSRLEPTEQAVLIMPPRAKGSILRQGWFVESYENTKGEQKLQIATVKKRPFSGIFSIDPLHEEQSSMVLDQVETGLI